MNKKLKIIIGIIAILIYLSSFFQECYLVNGKTSIGSFGLIAFLIGWLNFDIVGIIWLANPLFIISIILFITTNMKKTPLVLSVASTLIALFFMNVDQIIQNEGGGTGYIDGYLNGYWLWLTSMSLMTISSFINFILNFNLTKRKL